MLPTASSWGVPRRRGAGLLQARKRATTARCPPSRKSPRRARAFETIVADGRLRAPVRASATGVVGARSNRPYRADGGSRRGTAITRGRGGVGVITLMTLEFRSRTSRRDYHASSRDRLRPIFSTISRARRLVAACSRLAPPTTRVSRRAPDAQVDGARVPRPRRARPFPAAAAESSASRSGEGERRPPRPHVCGHPAAVRSRRQPESRSPRREARPASRAPFVGVGNRHRPADRLFEHHEMAIEGSMESARLRVAQPRQPLSVVFSTRGPQLPAFSTDKTEFKQRWRSRRACRGSTYAALAAGWQAGLVPRCGPIACCPTETTRQCHEPVAGDVAAPAQKIRVFTVGLGSPPSRPRARRDRRKTAPLASRGSPRGGGIYDDRLMLATSTAPLSIGRPEQTRRPCHLPGSETRVVRVEIPASELGPTAASTKAYPVVLSSR